jgi:hypothetical protein
MKEENFFQGIPFQGTALQGILFLRRRIWKLWDCTCGNPKSCNE